MRIIHLLAAIATIVLGSSLASAAVITTSGTFTNAQPGTATTTGIGTNTFTWGQGSPPSSLSFSGVSTDVATGGSFVFGTLDYYNGAISANSGANSVDLTVAVGIGGNGVGAQDFGLTLINTPNSANQQASADYVTITATLQDSTISIDNTSYTLEFLGFGNIGGGGFSEVNQFHVYENASASADLIGKLTVSTTATGVPELDAASAPSVFTLLAGAGAVFAARRRSA